MGFCGAYHGLGGCLTVATRHGGLDYATCEASFEAKGWDKSRTGVGRRGFVPITSGGRIRNNRRNAGGYADDTNYVTRSRAHARRRGNFRRQPGDVLCFRQGKQRNTSGRHAAACERRLRRLRSWRRLRPRRRLRRQRLRRLWRLPRLRRWRLPRLPRLRLWRLRLGLRLGRLHLLSVMGSLPALLDRNVPGSEHALRALTYVD
jgi:hypothetical protein